MIRTMMVPLDGSDFAEEAVAMGGVLASRLGAELHLVHVIPPTPDASFVGPGDDLAWREEAREGATRYLEEHASELRDEGVSVLTAVVEGQVVPALREYGDEVDVDLVVLTTHGTGGVQRWWLGSVADGLLRTSGMDLLLVRPWDDTEERDPSVARFERVAVALDGSETAETALPMAEELARRFDAELLLLRVVPAPVELTSIYGIRGVPLAGEGHRERVQEAEDYLAGVREQIELERVTAEVVEESRAAEGVVAAAQAAQAELLLLSTHGRGGLARVVLGSVADKIIRSSVLPVYVTRPSHSAE